jgi:hypothetical protein
VEWAIVRIKLSQSIQPFEFGNSWVQFRDALASKLLAQVKIGDYDSNADGILDHTWFVLASNEIDEGVNVTGYDFAMGGRSVHKNVDMFVDKGRGFSCVGCFNHELAHTSAIGLPDLYGNYSNLGDMSIMSYPWDPPQAGFLAYELVKLGWLKDYVVLSPEENYLYYCLRPMEDEFQAVLIENGDPNEFFMLEYHKRPESGWGSGWSSPFDGILITHIVPTGSNFALPPLIRIESADGDLQYAGPWPTETDLWYPENPKMQGTMFAGKLYSGEEVFTVGGFSRDGNAICFDVETYRCPPSYDSYNGHIYAPVVSGLDWESANAMAQTYKCCGSQGHLAVPESSGENEFIKAMLDGSEGWIGVTDAAVEGEYLDTAGQTQTYFNWRSNQPDNNPPGGDPPSGEDCVQIDADGKWNDLPCSYSLAFVIEFDCTE